MIIEVTNQGFLLRGALTAGPLFHTESYLVGPAMVRAYELESKKAIFPRVIVDGTVIDVARASHSDIHSPDDEEENIRALIARDKDGQDYIDYVSFNSVVDEAGTPPRQYGDYLTQGHLDDFGCRLRDDGSLAALGKRRDADTDR